MVRMCYMAAKLVSSDISDTLDPENRAAWRAWLEKNHADSPGLWVRIRKVGSTAPGLKLEEAVEEAICFGWIDSRLHPLDNDEFKLWFSRRKPASIWSQNNRIRVEHLITKGLMAPAGIAAVNIAKENGAWTSLVPIENLEIPSDLEEALASDPAAKENFDGFADSAKKMILRWIDTAKRHETRQKRINETVRNAAKNQKPFR